MLIISWYEQSDRFIASCMVLSAKRHPSLWLMSTRKPISWATLVSVGAHLNPAVTLSFCVLGKVPWGRLAPYCLSQLLGAYMASGLVYLIYYGMYWVQWLIYKKTTEDWNKSWPAVWLMMLLMYCMPLILYVGALTFINASLWSISHLQATGMRTLHPRSLFLLCNAHACLYIYIVSQMPSWTSVEEFWLYMAKMRQHLYLPHTPQSTWRWREVSSTRSVGGFV